MVIAVPAYKIAYMALPKAGCSSVKEMLARLDPDVDVPENPVHDTWHGIYPTKRFRPHRWEEVEKPGWFRFCVLRDPFQRLVSCYFNRVIRFQELKNSRKIRHQRDGIKLPTEPDIDFFFQNLKLYRQMSSSIKHHTLEAWLFVGPDLSRYSKVYPLERMSELAKDLQAHTGVPVDVSHGNATDKSANPRVSVDDLQPETRQALRAYLDGEYALVGAYYDNPLG